MSGTKNIDNKVRVEEDVLIFENSGVKIITGVADANIGTTIRDMTLNPGDMVISTEGNLHLLQPGGTFTNLSAPGSSVPLALLENVDWTLDTQTITFTSGATEGDTVHVTYSDGAARQTEELEVDEDGAVTLAELPETTSLIIINKLP